jgi:tetratricopeptide (TPR) repeat protein
MRAPMSSLLRILSWVIFISWSTILACALIDPARAAAGTRGENVSEARSLLGSYLSGRVARGDHDTASAAMFYGEALSRDPGNEILVEQSFLMEATEGNWDRAVPLARELVAMQPTHRSAQTFLGLVEFKAGRLTEAEDHFKAASTNPIGELTGALARAWVKVGQNKDKDALDLLEGGKQPEWAQAFLRYHRALAADLLGRRAEARAAYERIFKTDQRSLRTVMAYTQHASNSGDQKLAQSVLQTYFEKVKGDAHPMARVLKEKIDAGETMPLLMTTTTDGLAEVFYGVGEALSGEGGVNVGVIYLQFALYLKPGFPFALATLANVYENTKKYEAAIAAYDRIPKGTPLETSIEIRKALNLDQLERVDEAKALLEAIIRKDPQNILPLDALGSIMRGHKRYAEAVDYYSRAIALIDKPQAKHWTYYYSRGTCYERLKKWPPAEADLQRALKLSPDQSVVLNYLGYSWVDQNKNLKQGMALIEKAVRLKPDDGYIVDSLGWAHYRLGNYKDAVKFLERAVELKPDDPVLNDHLGDGFWRVGREREARFQWEQALTLKPEPEDAEKIKKKLEKGLPGLAQPRQAKKTKEVQRAQPTRRTDTDLGPASLPFVQ